MVIQVVVTPTATILDLTTINTSTQQQIAHATQIQGIIRQVRVITLQQRDIILATKAVT